MTSSPAYHEYFEYRRYPLRLPALAGGADPVRHPVAIAGGGPIGLALALGLARHGVRSVVIEADDAVSYGSRAACISRRSLEILARLDAARPVLDEALAWTAGTSYYRDVPVYRLQMPMDENQRFPPMVNLRAVPVRAAARRPGRTPSSWSRSAGRRSSRGWSATATA